MSQERTEKATPRRRQKARDEGQVAKSKELTSALTLFAGMLFLFIVIKTVLGDLQNMLVDALSLKQGYNITEDNVIDYLLYYLMINVKVVLPFMGAVAVVGGVATFAQIGGMFSTKVLKPKMSNLSPLKGLKKMFTMRTLIDLVRALLNIIIIAFVGYTVIKGSLDQLLQLSYLNLDDAVGIVGGLIFKLGMITSIVLIILGVGDFLYQRYEFEKSIRMSKQEVKQEYKDTEGDPAIVSKRRERMRQLAMNRMMQAVPKADVIITNPTHIAVAIQYDIESMDAPLVLAMGEDRIAQKIREVAKEHKIEIVENKPLARALYETAEVGQVIPVDLYQAVAEVLAFVYRLQKRKI